MCLLINRLFNIQMELQCLIITEIVVYKCLNINSILITTEVKNKEKIEWFKKGCLVTLLSRNLNS